MKRNQAAFFMALAIVPISLLSCNKDVMTDNEKAKADFLENVKRIEEAVQEVLDLNWIPKDIFMKDW